jgi:hypothetical protein
LGNLNVKERLTALTLTPVDDFRRDSDLFVEAMRNAEAQERIQVAITRGFQTRDTEMGLGRLLAIWLIVDRRKEMAELVPLAGAFRRNQ